MRLGGPHSLSGSSFGEENNFKNLLAFYVIQLANVLYSQVD